MNITIKIEAPDFLINMNKMPMKLNPTSTQVFIQKMCKTWDIRFFPCY
jgi:hypothetical protein